MDPAQIETLRGDLGRPAAEDVVCRAMEEVAQRMCTLQNQALSGPREEMHKGLRALAAIADQIGMLALSHVAGDVTYCIDRADTNAVASTLSRLIRVGERSLTAVWDIQDFSI